MTDKQERQSHFFASCVCGWVIGETRDEAVKRLVAGFRAEIKRGVAAAHKKGQNGFYIWSCQVNEPASATYAIEFYAPKGVDFTNSDHHFVTYVTSKTCAYSSHNSAEAVSL